jgi:hypothetical protein
MFGTLKGVGWVYRHTFVDTYAKAGFAKVHDGKTPIMAADLRNGLVLPFPAENAAACSQRSRRRIARHPRPPRMQTLPRSQEHRPSRRQPFH